MVKLGDMARRTVLIVAAAVVVVAAGVYALRRDRGGVPVDVEPARRQAIFRSFVTASGQIVATRYADIGASAMGRLVKLMVKEGDTVRAGTVLARIDAVQAAAASAAAAARVQAAAADERAAEAQDRAAQADLAAAEARAHEAGLTVARTRELRAQGLVAQADLDRDTASANQATAQADAAKAALGSARQARESAARRLAESRADATRIADQLSKTEIIAPMDGIVTRLPVQEGEMVVIGIQNQPGTTLMTISDLSAIDAEVKVAEADVLRVASGQTATVTLEALPGVRLSGHVVEIGASALPITGAGAAAREFKVKVRLARPDPQLRPGLTCDAEILTAERQNVLTVPLQAVVIRPGIGGKEQTGVFVVEGRAARFRPVQTALIGGLDMEVSGIADATPVVSGPYQALRDLADGQAVRPQARPQ